MKPADEYHLIDLAKSESLGGFISLAAARQEARAEGLARYQIWHGPMRVEHHDETAGEKIRPIPDADPLACRRLALDCATRAQLAADPRLADVLSSMARNWIRLACQIERAIALVDDEKEPA